MILTLILLAGPTRVAFLGPANGAADLSSLLGRSYQVEVFPSPDQLPELKKFQPNFVITGVDRRTPPDRLDSFVPDLEKRIADLKDLPGHPKVLLRLPAPTTDFDSVVLRPLVSQAARETGTSSVESQSAMPIDDAREIFFEIYDWKQAKAGWRIVSADSEQSDEGPASNAIDGDPETYWHTQYSPVEAKYPHQLIIDMGKPTLIGGIRYLPRQDGGVNGRIKAYEIWTSQVGPDSWQGPTAIGVFANTMAATAVYFKSAVRARFIKFRAISEQTGQPYASIAELDALPAKLATGG